MRVTTPINLLAFAVVILLCVAVIFISSKSKSNLDAWNLYEGELGVYDVLIEEYMWSGAWYRLVHLHPKKYEESAPNPFAISGHDYNGDEQFDRLIIREFPESGLNSVSFEMDGKQVWEPWPQNKDIVQPFSVSQIDLALAQLNLAMNTIRNQEHLVTTLESFRAW